MRKKGKRLEEGLKRPSSSNGKAHGMKLQTAARPGLRCKKCDRNSKLCGCEKLKECLMKIFNSKFNKILTTSVSFSMGGKLRSLQEKLAGSSNSSVADIAKEAKDVYSTFTSTFSFAKDNEELGEEFIQNLYGSEFTIEELFEVAESLEKRIETLLEEYAIELNNNDDEKTNSMPRMEFEEFPLAAPEEGMFHDFECPGINHYYVATSQYYKMLLQPPQTPFPKPIQNKANSVQSVEHISNPKTLENYNAKKLAFKEAGKVNTEKKVKEMLLFHGTDASNIDNILKEGFNANFKPKHKRKLQLYGRGIYVAEHPEMAFHYGNIILVCKVNNTSYFLSNLFS